MFDVRRLQPGDEHVLTTLSCEIADFGLSDDGGAATPLEPDQATAYLRNSSVLHWVALEAVVVLGTIVAVKVPLPIAPAVELLLHEIGVRESARRQGVGTALLGAMNEWMCANGVDTVWLLADGEGAEAFYATCGFTVQPDQPCYMLRTLSKHQ